MQFIFMQVLMKRIRAIPSFMKDRTVPFRKKIFIVLGIVYMLSPIDLIPDPVLIFGVIDDIVIWAMILFYLKDELDRYWLGEKEIKPEKRFRGKNIIDDVEFEVRDSATKKADGDTDNKEQKDKRQDEKV